MRIKNIKDEIFELNLEDRVILKHNGKPGVPKRLNGEVAKVIGYYNSLILIDLCFKRGRYYITPNQIQKKLLN